MGSGISMECPCPAPYVDTQVKKSDGTYECKCMKPIITEKTEQLPTTSDRKTQGDTPIPGGSIDKTGKICTCKQPFLSKQVQRSDGSYRCRCMLDGSIENTPENVIAFQKKTNLPLGEASNQNLLDFQKKTNLPLGLGKDATIAISVILSMLAVFVIIVLIRRKS
jgi:hypothetical protein